MKYLSKVFILIISGCASPEPDIIPETSNLSAATVNHKYQEIIEISGGAVNKSSVSVIVTPSDSGLTWNPEEIKYNSGGEEGVSKNYHRIIISGIPKKAGDYFRFYPRHYVLW